MREMIIGTGAAPADMTLDLGTLHPTSHGALRLRLQVDDAGVVRSAEGMPGLLHRGAEKLFEARDYRQVIMLADRHDWHGAFGSEVGAALAVERLAGIVVPPRATWIRTMMSEVTRIQSSLAFLGASLEVPQALHAREVLLSWVEAYTGNRIHPMLCRVGGVSMDVSDNLLDQLVTGVSDSCAAADALDGALASRRGDDFRDVAVLSAADAQAMGASGPTARASGVDIDLRRDDPYLAYAELPVHVVSRTAGDAHSRLECMLSDLRVAAALAHRCIERLREESGPIDVRLPKVLRAPEGSTYVWTENPSGINGYHLVSTGEPAPWRMKIRSAGFGNLQALARALPGTRLDQLPAAVMSFALTAGDIDR